MRTSTLSRQTTPAMAMRVIQGCKWRFSGELGRRIAANEEQWLLRAPDANPGLLDMFRRRNRKHPYPEHTPWAGEFAGKYLTSAVEAYRLTRSDKLARHLREFVQDLIATQGDDGYLGPWPKEQQLLGHCDLWGHYHCMWGLVAYADEFGDQAAWQSVLRAAEAICKVYGEGGRRPIEAGNPCFNLSVIHVLAELYVRTGDERLLTVIRRIEEDLPRDGDWLQKGIEGVPYWRLPGSGPRWEALHILQGFLTLWEGTRDNRYRTAVLNHWRSIRDLDRHPSGAFSTNEQASGTIFSRGSIETCCSVAWMALSCDVLRLTGDPAVADELELTLWNQALAAQHPSGSWCTYDTPLNGIRAPSYHQINFQYRPGTPELNCCSVNSPRMLGLLANWAVMHMDEAVVVNFYGPCTVKVPLEGGRSLTLTQKTTYPVDGRVRMELDAGGQRLAVRLRIPAWSQNTQLSINGKPHMSPIAPGTYVEIHRPWSKGDRLELVLDMHPRVTQGEAPDRGGCVAIHTGPLLLTFDTGWNDIELADVAPLDLRSLSPKHLADTAFKRATAGLPFPPMGLWEVPTVSGQVIRLCDFASAGARGTEYAAWLRATGIAPPPVRLMLPEHRTVGKPGPILFTWSGTGVPEDRYELVIASDAQLKDVVLVRSDLTAPRLILDEFAEQGTFYWTVRAYNEWGKTESRGEPREFSVFPSASAHFLAMRSDGCLLDVPLRGSSEPLLGVQTFAAGVHPTEGPHGQPNGALTFTGQGSGLRYRIPFFPERDYTFAAWVKPARGPQGFGQIVSAWCRGMDDPLRVSVENSEVSARIEAGAAFRTRGVALEAERWVHVAVVKRGNQLTLYLDGKEEDTCTVPEALSTVATELGIGFNPFYHGGEYFTGSIAAVRFYARALAVDELIQLRESSR